MTKTPFLIDLKDPLDSYLSGVEQRAKYDEMKAQQEEAQTMRSLREDFFKAPSQEGLNKLSFFMDPARTKVIQDNFSQLDENKKLSMINTLGQISSAFKSGRPELGIGIVKRYEEAEKNAGNAEYAQKYNFIGELLRTTPADRIGAALDNYLSFIPGSEKVISSQQTQAQTKAIPRQVGVSEGSLLETIRSNKATEDINKRRLDLEKIGLDQKTIELGLTAERDAIANKEKLAEFNKKYGEDRGGVATESGRILVNSLTQEAQKAQSEAKSLSKLSEDIKNNKDNLGGGLKAEGVETLKRWFGNENGTSLLYNELIRLQTQQTMGNLPGTAQISNADLDFAKRGTQSAYANPNAAQLLVDKMIKIKNAESSQKQAMVSWVSKFGSLQDAEFGANIKNTSVKKGESFSDFYRRKVEAEEAAAKSQADKKLEQEKKAAIDARLKAAKTTFFDQSKKGSVPVQLTPEEQRILEKQLGR